MVISITKNNNYIMYIIFEIVLTSIVTFLGIGLFIFFLLIRSKSTETLLNLLENPLLFALIILIPVLLGTLFIFYKRSRNYIVGYEFNSDKNNIALSYRTLFTKESIIIEL